MLTLSPTQRILLSVAPLDFRKGMDGIAALCRQHLGEDPWDGTLFVFTNRRRNGVRLLFYDGQGFWLATKRLSQGRLVWWPETDTPAQPLAARELAILLWNGQPQKTPWAPLWRPIPLRGQPATARSSMAKNGPSPASADPAVPAASSDRQKGSPDSAGRWPAGSTTGSPPPLHAAS